MTITKTLSINSSGRKVEIIVSRTKELQYAQKITARQIKVHPSKAIEIEQKLLDMGIQAGNIAPGRINIRWGGKRPGAGRPVTGRKQRKLQATDAEWELIRKYADEVRNPKR